MESNFSLCSVEYNKMLRSMPAFICYTSFTSNFSLGRQHDWHINTNCKTIIKYYCYQHMLYIVSLSHECVENYWQLETFFYFISELTTRTNNFISSIFSRDCNRRISDAQSTTNYVEYITFYYVLSVIEIW